MWLNHFNREQDKVNRINNKYEMNTQRILHNPNMFGSELNNLAESKKQQMQSTQIGLG